MGVAFQLQDGTGFQEGTFGIEASFQFGAARIGNEAFANTFNVRFADHIFRVTHREDPYVHYPSHEKGFVHSNNELHFTGDAAWDQSSQTSYTRCANNGEDPRCSIEKSPGPLTQHTEYLQPLVEVDMSAASCKRGPASVLV